MIKKSRESLWIALSLLSLVSCGANLTPDESLGVGAVTGSAVTKVIDKTKEIAHYDLKLEVPSIEVCYAEDIHEDTEQTVFRCVLTNCKSANCERFKSGALIADEILNQDALIISLDGWSGFIENIKFFCAKVDCKEEVKQYNGKQVVLTK